MPRACVRVCVAGGGRGVTDMHTACFCLHPVASAACVAAAAVLLCLGCCMLTLCLLGYRTRAASHPKFKNAVTVGEGSTLGAKVSLKKCVVGAHCSIGAGSKLNGCVVMDHVNIGDQCVACLDRRTVHTRLVPNTIHALTVLACCECDCAQLCAAERHCVFRRDGWAKEPSEGQPNWHQLHRTCELCVWLQVILAPCTTAH